LDLLGALRQDPRAAGKQPKKTGRNQSRASRDWLGKTRVKEGTGGQGTGSPS
jgi:hypothetical protein